MHRGLLGLLIAVFLLPAVPAGAADWAPPVVLGQGGLLYPRDGVVAGDGTMLFAAQDNDELVITRRTPGQPLLTSRLPHPRDYAYAAAPGGTVALLAITETPGGLEGRVHSWKPGDEEATVTGPYAAGDTDYALTFFDDTHVGIVEGGYGDAARQITGELGGTLTPAPLVRADGQPMPVTTPVTASRAGQSPVVLFGTYFNGRLLMARASGTSFGPVTVLGTFTQPGADFPPNVYEVQPSLAADGSLTVAFATSGSAESGGTNTIFNAVRAARITPAGALADARVLDSTTRVVTSESDTGDMLVMRDNVTAPGGGQTVLWDRQGPITNHVLAARRPAGAAEFADAQTLYEGEAGRVQGVVLGLGLVAHPDGGVSAAAFDQSQDEGTAFVTGFTAAGQGGAFGEGRVLLEAPYTPGGLPRGAGFAPGDDTGVVALRDSGGTLRVRQFDATPPLVSIAGVTADGERAFKFAATASDALSGPPSLKWSFGDGAEATGAEVRHQYAAAGSYTVTVTATDAAGLQATASRVVEVAAPLPGPVTPVTPITPAADKTAPDLTDVEVLPKRVRRGRAATLRFNTSEPALVTVTITRRASGVRRGGRCVAGRARTRAKRCTRAVTVRTVSAPFAKGYGTLKLTTRKLPLGKLTVHLTATDAAGNNSAPVTRRLVVRRR